jgi:RNA polymerase sigma-70 factor (ECF subfamily)
MPADEKRLLQLVKSLKQGDLTAFDELYELTQKAVFFSAYALTQDRELIADLMQETYADFLKSIAAVRPGETVTAYLCRIIHNKAINELKRRGHEVPLDPLLNEDLEEGQEDKNEDDSLFVLARKLLTPDEYSIVIMHSVNEMKFNSISKSLNKPLGTVLWLYNRAMKKLKTELEKEEER